MKKPLLVLSLLVCMRVTATDRAHQVMMEGQVMPDQGNGLYRNPILAGDYADPSVVRVGKDYYMTHTSHHALPGLLIWHSRDLVNWRPIGHALHEYIGNVWAPDFIYHDGKFYIYIPVEVTREEGSKYRTNFVLYADRPEGPWSKPVDLKIERIDPGHIADRNGNRYLYLSDGYMVRLSRDGLKITGIPEKVYDGWEFPDEWVVECKCLESPKLLFRDGFYYLLSAQGGTAGPVTSHMITAARAESPEGPWINSPLNPVLRTQTLDERWWSAGHGTLIDDVDGNSWVMLHAYDAGYRTLGRHTLLMPISWTEDGWPVIKNGRAMTDLMAKPAGDNVGHGMALSDPFQNRLGLQWKSWRLDGNADFYRVENGLLVMNARGDTPGEAAMLALYPGNHAYDARVILELHGEEAEAGLLLHYNAEKYVGLSLKNGQVIRYGMWGGNRQYSYAGSVIHLRILNDRHQISYFTSPDGIRWTQCRQSSETSAYHHNVLRGFQSLKIGLFASGRGEVFFRDFTYRGLDE